MRTRSIGVVGVCLLATCLSGRSAFAWGPQGHMMVAYVIWQELPPAQQNQCIDILMKLPDKENSILRGLPQGLSKDKRNMFIFMKAATWPDIIRSGDDPQHGEHRPSWHFINLPIDFSNANHPAPPFVAPAGSEPDNAVQALAACEKILGGNNADPERRAIALCWMLHLIGDIHQPLHASALFSKTFPKGDRGGNLFIVNQNTHDVALHKVWDSLPGTSRVPATAAKRAEEWRSDADLSRNAFATEIAKTAYKEWTQESLEAARDTAYDNGKIRGANEELIKEGADVSVPTLPAGYIQEALSVAQQRIVLAGYRGSDKLREILK